MLLALTAVASLSIGYDLSRFIWRSERDELSWAERALYASLIGVALWLSSVWIIAFLGLLTRPVILGRTAVFVIAAIAFRVRAGGFRGLAQREFDSRRVAQLGLPLLPLFLWCVFILWRSVVVPPLSHDALSFHLPKAALWIQNEGYRRLDEWAVIMGPRPSSYEIALADAILLDGDDTYTEWHSTLFYLLFIVASVAMTQRWWGNDPVLSVAMMLLAGATPVLLLQSGAHKNDLMVAYFMIGGAIAAARFVTTSDLRDITIAGIAFAAAAGTKQHGPILAICIAPFLIRPLLRAQWSVRRAIAIALVAIFSIAFLGAGAHYLDRRPAPAAAPQPVTAQTTTEPSGSVYGDWANLWIGPWALIVGPFTYRNAIFVPGYGSWYWPRHEIYFSHLGIPFAIGAVLLAFGIARYWRSGTAEIRRERIILTIATLVAFFAILPIRATPFGIYMMTLARFVQFLVPVVLNWTLIPVIQELVQRQMAKMALAAVSVCFVVYAFENATSDSFVPLSYVDFARQNPGTRVIPFGPNRPASVVDRIAGPHDVIAVDGGASTWIYPAFGAKLGRRLILTRTGPTGAAQIPNEAKWVIVDRSWAVIWGDRRFRSLSDAGKYLTRGEPAQDDIQALVRMRNDPRYFTVFWRPRSLQAVFVRRDAVPMPQGTPDASAPRSGAR